MTSAEDSRDGVAERNVYGHALELLARNLPSDAAGRVHLDLACGRGDIAEPARQRFGVEYVGVDIDEAELKELTSRGFEAHVADLASSQVAARLREIVGGRSLASITFLDGLGQLNDGTALLAAIADLAAEHRALVVTSVPNVTHIDIGVKTLLGRWDHTPAGLLDQGHRRLYSRDSLTRTFKAAGLRPIDEHDVRMRESDQHFPADHVGLSEHTAFGQWVRSVREVAEPSMLVNQFVGAWAPAPPVVDPAADEPSSDPERPFLSVLMRTQGKRERELREALLSLAAQQSTDFEVLVLGHKVDVAQQVMIEQVILDQMPSFRERIRLLLPDEGGRAYPLNYGLERARGRYVSIFDDDDAVLDNWVSAFEKAAQSRPGQVIRGLVFNQDSEVVPVRGSSGVRATGAPTVAYREEFYLVDHVAQNESPTLGWAFPRSLYTDFGLRFDEDLSTTEDWDFLLRAAQLAGVFDVGELVAIYRHWNREESSRSLHTADEWRENQLAVQKRIDGRPLLLPAGESRHLREQILRLRALEGQVAQGLLVPPSPPTTQIPTFRQWVALRTRLRRLKHRTRIRTRLRALLGR